MKQLFITIVTVFILLLDCTTLSFAQTATVSGAGTGGVNGTYTQAGTSNSRPYFTYGIYRLEYRDGGYGIEWEIWDTNESNLSYEVKYYNLSTALTPPSIGWQTDVASVPAPTVNYVLPVELTSFNAIISKSTVELNWQTATEVNNYGFEVERAATSLVMKWEKICFIQGHGNSNSPKEYSYADKPDGGSRFKYRLKQIDTDGKYEYSPEVEVSFNVPSDFSVKQNFPNPFNPTTKIEFSIPSDDNVQIKVFNVLGMEVATLLDEHRQAGTYSVEFSTIGGASNLSSGVYFYRIVSGKYSQIKKMILLR
ncbi:MAG: T9SS type A sorting domain-containing protein [Ignavibacteriaceae bacterium]|jgi:hypothetical protein